MFELALGLKLISLRVVLEPLVWKWFEERYADMLSCRILSLPFTYLGLPIGANPRRLEMWSPVINKFSKKLFIWKHKHISLGGRFV